jgi:hypothetical protein
VLYGTTNGGGLCGYVNGSGTVFKLVRDTGHGWKRDRDQCFAAVQLATALTPQVA